jgi:hypothetical protein
MLIKPLPFSIWFLIIQALFTCPSKDHNNTGRNHIYGRNSNILIPDPYPEWIKFLAPETNTGLLLQKIGCTVIWNYFQL